MIEFRAASVAEAAEICAVIRRAEAHDGVPRLLEVDELVEEFESDAVDLRESSRVAVADGEIVGIVYLYHRPAEAVAQRAEIQGALDPHWRQRGIGRELVGWAVLRAASVLTAIPSDLPRFVRWSAYEQDHSTHRLAARLGFTPVRWYDDLLRPLTDLPEPATIPGIRIEVWPADRDEEIRLTKNTAFLDHWGSVPFTAGQWHQHVHGFGGRPDLSFIAIDDISGAVVSLLLTHRYEADDELLGRRDAWIQTLGTLRGWRGRGVGSALIATALHAYAGAGLTHASLEVDSENPSGAAELYRALGFSPQHRMVAHEIALEHPAGTSVVS